MTHKQAVILLTQGKSATIDYETRLEINSQEASIDVLFYGNPIIRLYKNGDQQFWSGGNKSYTLWQRLNKFSDGVICIKGDGAMGDMFLEKDGISYDFTEGVLIEE